MPTSPCFGFTSLCSLLLYLPMPLRSKPKFQPVTLELEGVTLTTTISSETNVHHVECDLCGENIAHSATTTLTILDTQPVASGSGSSSSTDQPGSGDNTPKTPTRSNPMSTGGTTTPTQGNTSPSVPSTPTNLNWVLGMSPLSEPNPELPSNLPEDPCPGIGVPWTAGSIWANYPYALHEKLESRWEPHCFDSKTNTLYFRAEDCLFPESGSRGEVCSFCKELPYLAAFVKLKARAVEAKEHTPWDYLIPRQHQAILTKLTDVVNRLQTKASIPDQVNLLKLTVFFQLQNAEVSGQRLQQKNSDYSQIMFLISNNEFAGLRRTLKAALKRGASAKMILHILERALAGLYRPRGGFTKCELDISFLAKALGGPKLLYALQKSQGLASVSTVLQHQPIPQLLPSIGVPLKEEVDQNISSFFNPEIRPPASYPGC
ncbi:hypothetical protein B0H19DRAFT_1065949 [Mycena capillaripes]|nr:hypothetical protein B0H19DRAFT_1065949 [Mycena capillaripes]